MGKYSLENYYPYETYKIRPEPLSEVTPNIGRGEFSFLEYTWEDLEPDRGNYDIARMRERPSTIHNSILIIKQDPPSWLKEDTSYLKNNREECFAHLIRRVGSCLAEEPYIVGVVINTAGESTRVWDAYLEAFDNFPLLVELENEKLIRYLQKKGNSFGLLIKCGENNWIECCEKLAEHQLWNTWERMPVILLITDMIAGPNIRREGQRWHAGFANRLMDFGYNFTLRRLTYPKKIVGNGALPMRFWFVNTGSAPSYNKFQLMLKLEFRQELPNDPQHEHIYESQQGDQYEPEHGNSNEPKQEHPCDLAQRNSYESQQENSYLPQQRTPSEAEQTDYNFPLHIDHNTWKIGDITHNEILPLPDMKNGIYLLSVGMFLSDGTPINLDLQAKKKQGYYELGIVEVNNSLTDDLQHAWDNFYPEGYYPLEDPQVPNVTNS
jgi:hypothetical protein